jgi:hypothetical protein
VDAVNAQEAAPAALNAPAAQGAHTALVAPPTPGAKVPAGQGVGFTEDSGQ